jgi:hypothetical protein
MKTANVFAILFLTTLFLFTSLLLESWDWPSDEQIGYTYKELAIMKIACEKDLPRSQECVVVVNFEVQPKRQ